MASRILLSMNSGKTPAARIQGERGSDDHPG